MVFPVRLAAFNPRKRLRIRDARPVVKAGGYALSILCLTSALFAEGPQAALSHALHGTPASAVVIELKGGHTVASVGSPNRQSTPGSILKPLFLADALADHVVLPQTQIFCRRSFHLRDGNRDWDLACSHPQSDVAFNAQEALAYSCNHYFADLADRLSPTQAVAILQHYDLAGVSPQSRERKELLVLGLAGITVSPVQMAGAYRKLYLQPTDASVREGLKDSVVYGMAHNAAVAGVEIAGKTGTAGDPGQTWSHGWFAGLGFSGHEQVVIVVYLPQGNGGDTALLARGFFLAAQAP